MTAPDGLQGKCRKSSIIDLLFAEIPYMFNFNFYLIHPFHLCYVLPFFKKRKSQQGLSLCSWLKKKKNEVQKPG